jgi:hypothetical protein
VVSTDGIVRKAMDSFAVANAAEQDSRRAGVKEVEASDSVAGESKIRRRSTFKQRMESSGSKMEDQFHFFGCSTRAMFRPGYLYPPVVDSSNKVPSWFLGVRMRRWLLEPEMMTMPLIVSPAGFYSAKRHQRRHVSVWGRYATEKRKFELKTKALESLGKGSRKVKLLLNLILNRNSLIQIEFKL